MISGFEIIEWSTPPIYETFLFFYATAVLILSPLLSF
jgi:hypothetical protein